MAKRRLIVSSVGVSLLSSHQTPEERREAPGRLVRLANMKQLLREDLEYVSALADRVSSTLAQGTVLDIRRKSAELNGLYAVWEGVADTGNQDEHMLIATDTYLGRLCAELVESYLRNLGFVAFTFVPKKLSAINSESFEEGSKDLILYFAETLPNYKDQEYQIVFNLVAAFKALQGYLNTLGMFYADQIVYLFEGEDAKPIIIPRLPIQIDYERLLPFCIPLALMAEGNANRPLVELEGLPRSLFDQIDGKAFISDWGLLVWQQIREEALGGELVDFPLLEYTEPFKRDFRKANSSERIRLQTTLAKVSALLEDAGGNPAILKGRGGIQYDNYAGKSDQGRPIGHFRISDGVRVSCLAQSGRLILRHYGAHDYVENNP